MLTLTSFGAAREVTGSKHVLDTGAARLLIDCGVVQGKREEAHRRNVELPFDARAITASINTHGHLDHCGSYPLLSRRGFRGRIWATGATADIARLVMEDSARIQASDARFLDRGESPFAFDNLRYVRTPAESKALNDLKMPCVIVSASGMCEGGRILHHLLHGLPDPRNTVVIVGYMGEHTLGRALADKRREVRVFGEPVEVRARVKILNAFSAHADRAEIGRWVGALDPSRLKGVFLVHGEPAAQTALTTHLLGLGVPRVEALVEGAAVSLA